MFPVKHHEVIPRYLIITVKFMAAGRGLSVKGQTTENSTYSRPFHKDNFKFCYHDDRLHFQCLLEDSWRLSATPLWSTIIRTPMATLKFVDTLAAWQSGSISPTLPYPDRFTLRESLEANVLTRESLRNCSTDEMITQIAMTSVYSIDRRQECARWHVCAQHSNSNNQTLHVSSLPSANVMKSLTQSGLGQLY